MGNDLRRSVALGTQIGVGEIEGAREGAVDRAGAETKADADHSVLLFDLRRGTAEDLRESRSRQFRIEAAPVHVAGDGLHEHRHTFAAPKDAVLALVFARGRIVGGGVDLLDSRFERRPARSAVAAVGHKHGGILAGEGKVHVVFKDRGGTHRHGRGDNVEYVLKVRVDARRQLRLLADLVQQRRVRVLAQVLQTVPKLVLLHKLLEDGGS